MPESAASTSTPAARSLSSAPWVAVMSSGDSHSWVATATAARLVGVQLDGRQSVGLAVDAVALGRIELRHPAGFEGDAQVA